MKYDTFFKYKAYCFSHKKPYFMRKYLIFYLYLYMFVILEYYKFIFCFSGRGEGVVLLRAHEYHCYLQYLLIYFYSIENLAS